MLNFLFWNLHRLPRIEILARLVAAENVDFLMLTECGALNPVDLVSALNQSGSRLFQHHPMRVEGPIEVFSTVPYSDAPPVHESARYTVRRLNTHGDVLLWIVHLPSGLYSDAADLNDGLRVLSAGIKGLEDRLENRRTVLVGDFNVDPFADGMTRATGLNATMDRSIAQRQQRVVDQESYPYFYNPMWGLMGDSSRGPPGTYYYAGGSGHGRTFWHTFDQVLVRPELLSRFHSADVRVLEGDGAVAFMRSSAGTLIPNAEVASDHLPLVFRLR